MVQRVFSFVTLVIFLLACLSLPVEVTDPIRSSAVASFAPVWHVASRFKSYLKDRPIFSSSPAAPQEAELQIEVQSLKAQLDAQDAWKGWLEHLRTESATLETLRTNAPFFQRRYEEMNDLIRRQFFAVLAPVIYRDPSSWSSSLWIQVGQKDNETLGRTVVAKNSPVVLGSSLVGVVEFVGRSQSRVRLITDSGLVVSVRAARGKLQDRELSRHLTALQTQISSRKDLFAEEEQKLFFCKILEQLQSRLGSEDGYFAKGQLQGSFAPFWRSRGLLLQGVGFNYDYPDAEGPARELRTGKPIGSSGLAVPLIQEGDTLVTSGLDGVFPAGLQVASVTNVSPLAEGAYAYDIQARPLAEHLNDLQTVFVLAPLAVEKEDSE